MGLGLGKQNHCLNATMRPRRRNMQEFHMKNKLAVEDRSLKCLKLNTVYYFRLVI
jgi:hypothetical protein